MVTNGLNKITQNETQDPQLVDNFCKSWVALRLGKDNNPCAQNLRLWEIKMAGVLGFEPR